MRSLRQFKEIRCVSIVRKILTRTFELQTPVISRKQNLCKSTRVRQLDFMNKIRSDPENYPEYKRKERERWFSRKVKLKPTTK